MASDRLFVPLEGIHYDAFANGCKVYELRKLERRFTEKHVYPGRKTTLCYGYGKRSRLYGVIKKVFIFESLSETFEILHWKEILPYAQNINDAHDQAQKYVSDSKIIVFKPDIQIAGPGECPRCRALLNTSVEKCPTCKAPLQVQNYQLSKDGQQIFNYKISTGNL